MYSFTSLSFPHALSQLAPSHAPRTTQCSRRPPPSLEELLQASLPASKKLPIRKIPADRGLPFIGPIKHRFDYFYNQDRDEFFTSRVRKYHSTVIRMNIPPGPSLSSDSNNVIALLDGKSFLVLFDLMKVDKRDLFTGTFMPSKQLTGGYRVLSYLDPSEANHPDLKRLVFSLLGSRLAHILPAFSSCYGELFLSLERQLAATGKADFDAVNDQAAFNFLARSLFGTNPADTSLGMEGPGIVSKWILFQLSPLLTLGFPKYLEHLTLHAFRLPASLVIKDYRRIYDFFHSVASSTLDEAEKLGISREEACHNLLFVTCFNSFGGMKILFPSIIKWISRAGMRLHTQLAQEIRTAVKSSNDGKVTVSVLDQMPLLKSVVYEVLRVAPPVPMQYGRAKTDFIVESHDAAFRVKEGEVVVGYQPLATRDPKIFDRAAEFVAERFVGDGERKLRHVLWSNGPESANPTVDDKQCAGKHFVVLVSRLLLVELFMRYDSFGIAANTCSNRNVTLTSLKRATF